MLIQKGRSSIFQALAAQKFLRRSMILCFVGGAFAHQGLLARSAPSAAVGLAWGISGTWRVAGNSSPLVNGDAMLPGSLLQPEPSGSRNAIVILLPDGRPVFFECSKVENCSRGFRVPQLYRDPDPFAVDMLARIRTALRSHANETSPAAAGQPPPRLPRDEVVTVLGSDKEVQLGGLVSKLPDARYTYDLHPLDSSSPSRSHVAVVKSGKSIPVSLPTPGLYELAFTDEQNNPRIRIYVAALAPAQSSVLDSFHRAHQLIAQFNEQYYGWPPHELGWAYVESFFLDAKAGEQAPAAEAAGGDDKPSAGKVTAEPAFDPLPGVFKLNQSVTLQCATPGGKIHFTVDGSQPLAVSPVYSAPINVMGSQLTIKAFASSPGRKDSPVVTGIFRIEHSQ